MLQFDIRVTLHETIAADPETGPVTTDDFHTTEDELNQLQEAALRLLSAPIFTWNENLSGPDFEKSRTFTLSLSHIRPHY